MKCKIQIQVNIPPSGKRLLLHFIKFCKKKLDINELPSSIIIYKCRDESQGMTTGGYNPNTNDIMVLGGRRMLLDIFRSLAHELTHHKQNERGTLLDMVNESDDDLNTEYENEAYECAGNLIKEWTRNIKKTHPDIYDAYCE